MGWFKKKLSPLDGYNRWAKTYSIESNPIKNFSDELIKKWMGDLSGKSFLDAGCGSGKICKLAQEEGAVKILGIDFSPVMIEEAKKNYPDIEFKCHDLSTNKIVGRFDCVICALVLGHLDDLNFVLTNLLNNVSDNGFVVITDFHPYLTLQGKRRTFTEKNSRKTFEIEHHLHLFEEYFSLFAKSNFYIEELVEPTWNEQPVVFGMKLRKRKN
ncbi:MAG: methyltransferase domain-containing protein [Bacteroidetes bacterium]|nr:methyltransferase domain-containing protein [Bacteroidota bacterium]